jgi:hypothetical protein
MNSFLLRIFLASADLLVIGCTTSGQHAGQAPAADESHAREAMPSQAQGTQQRFLKMFARSYFPGRSGQLLVVPREPAVWVTGVNVYDHIGHVRHEMFAGAEPGDLMALTLADVWQFATSGRAIILAHGSKPENLQIFIDEERMLKLGLPLPDLARFLRSQPFLFCAFTSDEVRLAAARL